MPDGKALPGSRLKGMDGGPESGKPSAIQGRSGHFLDHHAPPFLPVRDPTSQEPARTPSEPLCSCQAPDPLGEGQRPRERTWGCQRAGIGSKLIRWYSVGMVPPWCFRHRVLPKLG